MKLWFCTFLITALLVFLPAMAEEADGLLADALLEAETPIEMDLDGDGSTETVLWRSVSMNEYDEKVCMEVTFSSGETALWESGMLMSAQVCAADLGADGLTELFVSGDEMSNDYVTFCLRCADGALSQLQFADAGRGENSGGYFDAGYGSVTRLDGDRVTLCGSQDMLGTYMAERTFTLKDGRFELADDGLWTVSNALVDEDPWTYRALTLKQDCEVHIQADGSETSETLRAGEKILVVSSDKISVVHFQTEDGHTGSFSIAADTDRGWGSLVNGIPEDELFESIPYAD